MRIDVIQAPRLATVDGIELRRFVPGQSYEVGNRLGVLFLAEGWAVPVVDEKPALVIPLSEADPFLNRIMDRQSPLGRRSESAHEAATRYLPRIVRIAS